MLARPLNERDKGAQVLTCVPLSPALLLADDSDVNDSQIGVSSHPLPPGASTSSSPSFFSAPFAPPSLTTSATLSHSPPYFNFLTPFCVLPSVLPPPTLSVSSSTPFISPPVVAPCLPPPPSNSPPLSSSHFPPSVILSTSLHPPSHSSASPPRVAPSFLSSSSPPHPQSLHVSPLPHTSASPPITSPAPSCLAFICPPPLFNSSPSLPLSISHSPTLSSTSSLSPPPAQDSPPFFSSAHPPPPAASSVSLPSPLAILTPSPSSPPSPVSPSPSRTSAFLSVSSALQPPPNPPACCSCSSLLPRLLSAHRLEMRRLLRGALTSLSHRLDSLERRSRRKRRRKRIPRQGGEGLAAFKSSCSPDPIPTDTSSSTSPSPSSLLSLHKDLPLTKRKRMIKNYSDEEENAGRFVGQMRVSIKGVGEGEKEEVLLTLHDFNHRRREQGRICPPQKAAAVVRPNGYSYTDPSSQHALRLLQSAQRGLASSQSEALCVSFNQWHFSDFIPPASISSSQTFSCLRLCSSFSLAPPLMLSGLSIEMLSELLGGRAFGTPLRPLKDWTAPPSMSSDHCYMRRPTLRLICFTQQQQKQQANNISRSLYVPQGQPLPLYSANGLSALFPANQSKFCPRFECTNAECSKRVSQIRIRRATPRETPLTPMGLPKVKRLKKKDFSLEEIYTNKNYKSPTANRSLETIFEEPREKDGALLLIGQQKRRRLLLFPDFTQPRKRKRPQGFGLPLAMVPRKRVARRHCQSDGSGDDDIDVDVMLVERLSALEDFMMQQGLNTAALTLLGKSETVWRDCSGLSPSAAAAPAPLSSSQQLILNEMMKLNRRLTRFIHSNTWTPNE